MTFKDNTDYKINPITGCWIWVKDRSDDGYGLYRGSDGRMHYAHRQSFIQSNGPLEPGTEPHHDCWNPRCINPSHMTAQPRHRNCGSLDASSSGIQSMEQAKAIRLEKQKTGKTAKQLAVEFGVSTSAIYTALRNITFCDPDYTYTPVRRIRSRKREAIIRARRMFADGASLPEIADILRVSESTAHAYTTPRYRDLDPSSQGLENA